ncbi:MAG: glycyl-radical enzyme activating protein [Candidatus Thorarchaeota archaeon]|nr:MAG: glycyl-radical enzyme activating protein [Candidatus Thorarchaeota archaeon]RLI57261.1 MAG: glycyl-radical enzyme activating protein [Candidatus Thorarchaeota archaeon]
MTESAIVTNIQRCSTEDGPGIRTTVFFKGCPMKCLWCHNIEAIAPEPTLVWYAVKCIGDQACVRACPEHALKMTEEGLQIDRDLCKVCGVCEEACPTGAVKMMGTVWQLEDMVEELLRDKVFFTTSGGGVTLSGGEATYQGEFAAKLSARLQEEGVHVALDTCGYCSESVLRKVLAHVDMVLYDLKEMDPERHLEFTGVPIDTVLRNAKIVEESGKTIWIRTPIIPGHTDDDENIRAIGRFIVENMPSVERWDLLAFNKMCVDKYALLDLTYPLKDEPLMTDERMEHLAAVARQTGVKNVNWSGMTKELSERIINRDNEEVRRCGII